MSILNRAEMVFADSEGNSNLTTYRRKIVHELAGPLGLAHFSTGRGNKRVLHLLKNPRVLHQGKFNKETNSWEPGRIRCNKYTLVLIINEY